MTELMPRICNSCARSTGMQRCEAFPSGIPSAIYDGGFDHRRAYSGDSGLRYVQEPGTQVLLDQYEAYKRPMGG